LIGAANKIEEFFIRPLYQRSYADEAISVMPIRRMGEK
jgi:hypothetical protein